MSTDDITYTESDLQAKLSEVQENTRKALEKEYATRLEREATKYKSDATASTSAVFDQIAESLGYDGKFSSAAEIAEYFTTKVSSGTDVDVTKTKEYNSLRAEFQASLKKQQELEAKANKVVEEYTAKEKQRSISDAITKNFSSIAKDYVIPLEDAQALYLAKRQLDVTDEGLALRDSSGNPLFDSTGNLRTIADDMKEVLKPYLKLGGGAGGGTAASGSTPKKRSEMSASQKGEYIRKNGAEAYAKLPL